MKHIFRILLYITIVNRNKIKIIFRVETEQNEVASDKNLYDQMTSAFFQKEERTGNTLIENIYEYAKKSFLFIKQIRRVF